MAVLMTSGCQTTASTDPAAATAEASNPFFQDWASTQPFGAPPFDSIRIEHYKPAFERGMAEQIAEVNAITANTEAPTFANTVEAFEASGALLSKVAGVFYNVVSSHSTEELQAVETEMAPILSRHSSEIALNPALFQRIDAVYQQRASLNLTPEQLRLLERTHLGFVRDGARLTGEQRTRLAAIDERLSALSTQFDQNTLADTAAWTLQLNGEADMAGLSEDQRAAALQAGADLEREGQYLITLQRSSVEPFLQFSTRRDLRERAFRAWAARGENNNEYDNRAILRETLQLRLERARLLGYPTYAAYSLADSMAETPERAYGLMMEVWTPAVARANEERADMQRMIDAERGGFQLEAWDWRFYAEKVRAARYNVSDAEIRPYLQFDRIMEGAFWTANRLFGLTFTELHNVQTYHPDVRVFEVKKEGRTIGLYYLDPYARPTKQSGAWMSNFRDQQHFGGDVIPIVTNNWNYNKPQPGQPTLLSWDDAETVFHEFGHALHGLLSNTYYASLSGTSVARDYVEFPSQVMERWFASDEVLSRFALNAQGQAMPNELRQRIFAAENFNQGFSTVEYLGSALVDMDLHMQTSIPDNFDVSAFERDMTQRIHMPREIILRHRPPHFGHIMGGYAAGYYGYLWAEVLDADAFDAFTETGDVFNPQIAQRFEQYIFSSGNSRPEMESYRLFRGRLPTTEPLLRGRGFAPERAGATN